MNRSARAVAVSAAALLTVTLLPSEAWAARSPSRAGVDLPELQKEQPVPGGDSTAEFHLPAAPGTQVEYAPTNITPVDGGGGQVVFGGSGTPAQQLQVNATTQTGGPAWQQAGTLPIWIAPATGTAPAALASGSETESATTETEPVASGSWTVTASTRAQTEALGIDGVLFKLESSADATAADLRLDYRGFEQLYGAGWGTRLKLVQFPECFLTTPDAPGCTDAVELGSANSESADNVTTTIDPATAAQPQGGASLMAASAGGGTMVLAAVGGNSGGVGNYQATSLQPSGKWTAGGSSGGFNWSYGIQAPPVAAGPKPSVSLGYSSQSVDGRTSATNNQASWVGDGWDYHPGFIERTYRSCAGDKTNGNNTTNTGDLCWGSDNAVMSLDGTTTALVKDNTTSVWKPAQDDGTRVEQKFGAANGDDNGEYWVVTTPDGTKYHFGLNRLPGWTAGKSTTDSVFTVPVFGNQAGEPCHQSAYADSACDQAWRWNLDYVEDTHANAMALYWKQERNWYAKNGKVNEPKPYVRGGWLDRIEYGLRADSVYTRPAPAKVSFTVGERCLVTEAFDCAESKFSKYSTDALHWPDSPVDAMCKDTGKCLQGGPTFWTRKWLDTIITEVAKSPGSGDYRRVDEYSLKHNFLSTRYDTNPPAWLDSIQRKGYAPDGTSLSLPKGVTFHANAVDMPNRQSKPGEARPPFNRLRVEKIFSETGGGVVVKYSAPDPVCNPDATKPPPESNTSRCYPVFWSPDGEDTPKIEWFNKYVVEQVSEEDYVSREPAKVTRYRYLNPSKDEAGGAAWAKDTSEFTKASERTWNDWRGYERVQVVVGTADAAQAANEGITPSLTQYRYFRGMDGDPLTGTATRQATVYETGGKPYETGAPIARDLPQYAGSTAETVTYPADAPAPTAQVREIATPWSSDPTATQTRAGTSDLKAFQTGVALSRQTQAVSGGGTRTVETSTTFNTHGLPERVENRGQTNPALDGDEQCTITTYAPDNVAANIIGAPVQVRTTAGLCDTAATATPDRIVSASQTLYDNLAQGATPTKGDVTSVRTINSAGTDYVQTVATTYDVYGRPLNVTNAAGSTSKTTYIPSDNSTPTAIEGRDPLDRLTTTSLDTGRGLTLKVTDPNNRTVRIVYDALGRQTAAWSASRQATDATPDVRYTYDISSERVSVVTTETLRENGSYLVSKTLYDGLLRSRQTQAEAVGSGRVVTDTFYNSAGGTRRVNAAYYVLGEPADALFEPDSNTQIRTWVASTYDGLGRPLTSELWYGGASTPEKVTETQYAGDYVVTIPPSGGTRTRTWFDALGRMVKLDQFTSALDYTRATYGYDARGDRTTATDPAGNIWTWIYDARGQLVKSTDPDKGQTTFTYDNAGQATSESDARGNTLATTYDVLGRKTALRTSDANGPKIAEWTYDTVAGALGQPAKSIRYDNGNPYTTEVTGYDTEYRPLGTAVTIPATSENGALAGTYTTTTTYTPLGKVASTTLPAVGGLPSEKIVTRYNTDGLQLSMSGQGWYTSDTTYSPFGEVLRTQSGTAPKRLWTTSTYEEHTGQLLKSALHRETGPQHLVNETSYGYDKADNVARIKNRTTTPAGSISNDLQCFAFDALRRMTEAWTSSNADVCATTSTGAPTAVGGPDTYWNSYTYDAIGSRLSETLHDPAGANQDTLHTYVYQAPAAGSTHQLTSVTSTGPAGQHSNIYTYDAAGNTRTRTGTSGTQTLTWNTEDKLESLTTTGTDEVVRYVYDASGTLLIRRNQGKTTLLLDTDELVLNAATGAVSATRSYNTGAGLTAVRTNDGKVTFLSADHHGTDATNIDAETQEFTRRLTKPFGEERGTPPGNWPGQKGFVGGTVDVNTALTNLGARQYDPQLGRFLSPDPLQDLGDPQQWNAYAYSNNNPTTISDPSGLFGIFSIGIAAGLSKLNFASWSTIKTAGRDFAGGVVEGYGVMVRGAENTGSRIVGSFSCMWQSNTAAGCSPKRPSWNGFSNAIRRVGDKITVNKNSVLHQVGKFIGESTAIPTPGGGGAKAGGRVIAKGAAKAGGKAAGSAVVKDTVKATAERVASKCNSFPAATPVLMSDGTTKSIDTVKAGDKVIAADPLSGETAPETVTDTVFTPEDEAFTDVTVDTSNGKHETIKSTQHHPYWSPSHATWVDAADLKPGDTLLTADARTVAIVDVRSYTEPVGAHNITVQRLHTYYVVAGSTPILVHNSESCGVQGVLDSLPSRGKRDQTTGQGFQIGEDGSIAFQGEQHVSGRKDYSSDINDFLKASPDIVIPTTNPNFTFAVADHVETQIAWLQRAGKLPAHMNVAVNYPGGTCQGAGTTCWEAVEAILPKGYSMDVWHRDPETGALQLPTISLTGRG